MIYRSSQGLTNYICFFQFVDLDILLIGWTSLFFGSLILQE